MKHYYNLIITVVFSMFISCAQIVPLSGGLKDEQGPMMGNTSPINFSTNFNRNKIIIELDEFIKQNNLSNQLIISPALKKKPELKVKKKSVEVIFNEELKPNTTYTLNFGVGIIDITENNPIDSPLFVFSTGDYLDSLSISGYVKNSFTLKPEKDIFLQLYDDLSDSAFQTKKPTYFTKTKEDGSFSIDYLKEGKYNLFALKDANSNYIFDLPDEAIAFIGETIIPKHSSDSISLYLFEEEHEKQYLKSNSITDLRQGFKCIFTFNLPTKNVSILPLNVNFSKEKFIKEESINKDTLYFWIVDSLKSMDELQFTVKLDTAKTDTVTLFIVRNENRKQKENENTPPFLALSSNLNSSIPFDLNKDIRIEFARPLKTYDFKKIVLTEMNDTIPYTISFTDKTKRFLSLKFESKEEKNYQLYIPPAIFTDIYGLQNDTVFLHFFTPSLRQYGTLRLKINIPQSQFPYLLQLMNISEQVLQEKVLKGDETLYFEYLQPMSYKIKLVYDTNSNSKWDTGNFTEKRQPEKVLYYPSLITIRSSWDMELEWTIQ